MDPILYPNAIWKPLLNHSDPGTLEQKNLIVLHSTEGRTAQSAIWTFAGSTKPNRVSSHFVIDRDGTIYQLLSISDVGFHASEVNHRSIGIEHAAISPQGAGRLNKQFADKIAAGKCDPFVTMLATEAQYQKGALLVAWLCQQFKIPCDAQHVQPHSLASPEDHHDLCCRGALDDARVIYLANAALSKAIL